VAKIRYITYTRLPDAFGRRNAHWAIDRIPQKSFQDFDQYLCRVPADIETWGAEEAAIRSHPTWGSFLHSAGRDGALAIKEQNHLGRT
jgi:hypothetical protein